ncbi:MAG: S8 family serine peptidase [Candidatus Izemoplasmatales bacterium]
MKTEIFKKLYLAFIGVMVIFTSFFVFSFHDSYSYSFIDKTEIINPLSPPWTEVPTNDYTDQQFNLDLIDAYQAWTIETGSEDVIVAIIDSGIDTDHEEFVGRISNLSYNAYTEEVGIAGVEDELGHGTNVAGIIAAIRNNGLGIDGITDNVQLMVIKANRPDEEGYPNSLIAKGIYYAVDNGAKVINLSLGSTTEDLGVKVAVEYAYAHEVFVVAASGNDGNDVPFYPAALENSISVNSIDSNSVLSTFSNYGVTIDLSAPGDLVYTTNIGNGYAMVSGTSFAAPHVAGVLALLLSYNQFSFAEIYENIYTTTIDLGTEGKDIYYGNGLINAYNSLTTDLVNIIFETYDGEAIDPIWVEANSTYDVIYTPTLENYTFEGWYLDGLFTTPLNPDYIFSENTIIYAKYLPIYYDVTLMLDGNIYSTISVMSGDPITNLPVIEVEDQNFYGWFFSEDFLEKYNEQIIKSNLTLYAKVADFMFVVVFLDAYDNIYVETLVDPNNNVTPPAPPDKLSDELFDYDFIGWDQNLENITSDLIVKPIYKKTLIFYNVTLAPGIDTLQQFEVWIDAGIVLTDNSLTYIKTGTVDNLKIGKYIIVYSVYFEDELVYELQRIVNVIEQAQEVNITLNESLTTIIVGNDYLESGASSNIGTVEILGSVNTSESGKYIITYRVVYNNQTYEKSRYVFVIEESYVPLSEVDWFYLGSEQDEEN